MFRRRRFCAALLMVPLCAWAQRRLWRIGYHSGGSAETNAGWLDSFRKGMADLGWSEARHYVIDARYADGDAAATRRLAVELVATQPDVILTTAEGSILALARATKTIPIVFGIGVDPIGNGYAASLQRPGGNLTGIATLTSDLAAKRLQLLTEAFPNSSRIVVLFEPTDPAAVTQVKALQAQANLPLTLIEVRHAADAEKAIAQERSRGTAYIVMAGAMLNIHRKAVAEYLKRARAPSVSSSVIWADAGLLMTYAPSYPTSFRRAAVYVDKILKGAKPGELPIEQPTKFDLVINIRTAKALGIEIPESLRLRADRLIE